MSAQTQRPHWVFYPGWVAASAFSLLVAFAAYWVLIRPITGAVGDRMVVGGQSRITEDFLLPYIFWPTLAVANGLLQYLLLRRLLPRVGWWVVGTSLGWVLGLFGSRCLYHATFAAALDVRSVWFAAAKAVLTGGTIGLAQWIVLRRRVRQAAWWILANILGWGVSGALMEWLDMWVLVVPAIATVVALKLLLDQRLERVGNLP
jgi:hypothetical protein